MSLSLTGRADGLCWGKAPPSAIEENPRRHRELLSRVYKEATEERHIQHRYSPEYERYQARRIDRQAERWPTGGWHDLFERAPKNRPPIGRSPGPPSAPSGKLPAALPPFGRALAFACSNAVSRRRGDRGDRAPLRAPAGRQTAPAASWRER